VHVCNLKALDSIPTLVLFSWPRNFTHITQLEPCISCTVGVSTPSSVRHGIASWGLLPGRILLGLTLSQWVICRYSMASASFLDKCNHFPAALDFALFAFVCDFIHREIHVIECVYLYIFNFMPLKLLPAVVIQCGFICGVHVEVKQMLYNTSCSLWSNKYINLTTENRNCFMLLLFYCFTAGVVM